MKNVDSLVSYNMKNGRIFAGICDEIDWNKKEIILKNACEIQSNIITKDYKNRVKELYKTYNVKRKISFYMDDLESALVI